MRVKYEITFDALADVRLTVQVARGIDGIPMKIYLASNYSTWPEMQGYAKAITDIGHDVTSEWITGTHQGDNCREYALIDLRDIDAADALILFSDSPAGSRARGGKHVEFGYALAKGKRIFIVGNYGNVFHRLDGIVQRLTFEDLMPVLHGLM